MKKTIALLLILTLTVFAVSGCRTGTGNTKNENTTRTDTKASQTRDTQTQDTKTPAASDGESTQSVVASEPDETGTLYICIGEEVKEYPFSGEKTPDQLIKAMADLTGWNLELADTVSDGKGGMTVCFTKNSAIFTGPPEPQKEEFFMFDSVTLAKAILDSIQKTLQENYVDRAAGGDPAKLDIYFCVKDGDTITGIAVEESGITVPMDHPYDGVMIECN